VTRFGWLVLATLLASSSALADRPRGTYIVTDPDVSALGPGGPTSNVIYLNRCAPGDCDFTSSQIEDAVTNQSSILGQNGTLSPFAAGDTAWAAVVECVQKAYAPFDVVVTDQDPSPTPHFEAVVGGTPDQLGFPENVAGVAPFNCGVINNAITYSFANVFQDSVPHICWTVAQETAHAFGLDHEFLCEDPMTYLDTCGPEKWFRNVDAPCGEFEERGCMCGGTTQNSFTFIADVFGPGNNEPPTVQITAPQDGASVSKGFPVTATASDDIEIARVELWINNQMIQSADSEPYSFTVPANLSDGVQKVEVRAFDIYDVNSTAEIEVTQGAPCQSADQCQGSNTCVDGRCVLGPGAPGGLGEICTQNTQCASGQCGDDGTAKYCAEECEVGAGGCPDGFGCRQAGASAVCWPGYDEGGGCQAGASRGSQLAAIALAMLAVVIGAGRRRRR
jgi:hypothetical protein